VASFTRRLLNRRERGLGTPVGPTDGWTFWRKEIFLSLPDIDQRFIGCLGRRIFNVPTTYKALVTIEGAMNPISYLSHFTQAGSVCYLSGRVQETPLFSTATTAALGPNHLSVPREFLPKVTWLGHEVYHSPPNMSQVKKVAAIFPREVQGCCASLSPVAPRSVRNSASHSEGKITSYTFIHCENKKLKFL